MNEFMKQLNLPGKTMYFLFSEVYVSKGRKFFVTTTVNGCNFFFDMVCNQQGVWKLIGPVPDVISQVERDIITIVKNHLAVKRD